MKSRTISEHMMQDHERLLKLFNEFKRNRTRDNSAVFKKFKDSLSRHIKAEEKVLKNVKNPEFRILPIAESIQRDHRRIIEHLDRISAAIRDGEEPYYTDFYLLLRHHKNVEDRLLYPKLDDILKPKEKADIIETIGM